MVDELLDIQLEFEERLTEVEEQAHNDIENIKQQKDEVEEKGKR